MSAQPSSPPVEAPSQSGASPRRGQLALALQEAFTVAVRLRSNRQVAANADAFREQVKGLLAAADREARQAGYAGDDVRQAVYAYVAFLDESVLGSSQPMFQGWTRRPLQEEIFGDHVAGENFFRNLEALLARQDSEDLADLLEVFLLCLLLGFRGRFATHPEGARALEGDVLGRITRIRGVPPLVGPDWDFPVGESPPDARDPWMRRLGWLAVALLALGVVLYLVFRILLGSSLGELEALAGEMLR